MCGAGNNTLFSATANTLPIVGDGPKEKKDLAVATVGKDRIYVIGPDINNTKLETYVLDTGEPLPHPYCLSFVLLLDDSRTRVLMLCVCVCVRRAIGMVACEDQGR
jgi:hypothetical protein